ncbi:MAG: hypothetical protein L0220_16325, partial [Acidobacteria bacterium]|nr:hypothetical protein [Acidobacteriota bacterium]
MARLLTAIVFLPILFATLWADSPVWFVALAALGILLGLNEYYSLVNHGGQITGQTFCRVFCMLAAAAVLA